MWVNPLLSVDLYNHQYTLRTLVKQPIGIMMKDLVIVYLLPIRIIMSINCPCNRVAPGKLTSTFFGVYVPRYCVLGCHVILFCYLGLHLLLFVCTITKGQKNFWILRFYVVSSSSLVSSYQMFMSNLW